jgi:hypothetical protein
MNNIVLISCFCNTSKKLEVLRKNLQILKSNNLDTALISPIPVPEDVLKSCTYSFITKENPVLDWPTRAIGYWQVNNTSKGQVKLFTTVPDWGFTGLNHVKRLGEIFVNYDYDFYSYIIYDTILTPEVLNVLKNGHDAIVYPSKRKEKIWEVGLHLLSFNKENLIKLVSAIDKTDYIKSNGDFDAYDYLKNHIVIPFNFSVGEFPVEDEIDFNNNLELVNHSPTPELKYFISSPDPISGRIENLKIVFYQIPHPFELEFNINGNKLNLEIEEGNILDLGITKQEMNHISFKYLNETYDLTDVISSLKHTFAEKHG